MFTIKVYDQGTMDYTAFSAEKYRREFVRYRGGSVGCGLAKEDLPLERLVITLTGGRLETIEVEGCAFIENAAGKTIERIGLPSSTPK